MSLAQRFIETMNQGVWKKTNRGHNVIFFSQELLRPTLFPPHLPKKAISDQSALGLDCTGYAMYLVIYVFCHLIYIPHSFCIHKNRTSLQLALKTGPGTIDNTVTHLLAVSLNYLEISIQLTVKAHSGASEWRTSLSTTLDLHPSFSQTF